MMRDGKLNSLYPGAKRKTINEYEQTRSRMEHSQS
jgi:hypothetical protein